MIRVEIEPVLERTGYVLRVRDGQNGNILLSSTSQSYSHAADAEALARRLFGGPPTAAGVASGGGGAGPTATAVAVASGPVPEAVELVVALRNGAHRTELIR